MIKARHIVLAIGVIASGGLAIFGDKTPNADIAAPMERHVPALSSSMKSLPKPQMRIPDRKSKDTPIILSLIPREQLIGGAHAENSSEGLFGNQSWNPPPPPPPKVEHPPSAAPALPYIYLGKKWEDDAWEVYLGHGDQTLIVHEHDEIEGIYRVESIKPPTLSLTYLPLKQVQMLTIGESD